EDELYVDKALAFGVASSAGAWGIVGDALADVLRRTGMGPTIKWVDDYLLLRVRARDLPGINAQPAQRLCGSVPPPPFPSRDNEWAYSLADVDAVCAPLGIPWSPEKEQAFSGTVFFVGVWSDIAAREISLASDRVAKYLAECRDWVDRARHTKAQAQQLLGRLQFAAHAVPAGRPYLSGLVDFITLHELAEHRVPGRAHSDLVARRPNSRVRSDVLWWMQELERPRLARRFHNDLSLSDPGLYTEACDFGAGVVLGSSEAAYVFTTSWRTAGRDIMWAEAVGAELGMLHLIVAGFRDQRVVLYIDSTSVEGGLRRGRIRNAAANECIERFLHSAAKHNLEFAPVRVDTYNNPADAPSRGADAERPPLPHLALPSALHGLVRRVR
ncbi:hypothetical protein A4X09_0g3873, partial [Tilletia walkeri]